MYFILLYLFLYDVGDFVVASSEDINSGLLLNLLNAFKNTSFLFFENIS